MDTTRSMTLKIDLDEESRKRFPAQHPVEIIERALRDFYKNVSVEVVAEVTL